MLLVDCMGRCSARHGALGRHIGGKRDYLGQFDCPIRKLVKRGSQHRHYGAKGNGNLKRPGLRLCLACLLGYPVGWLCG